MFRIFDDMWRRSGYSVALEGYQNAMPNCMRKNYQVVLIHYIIYICTVYNCVMYS